MNLPEISFLIMLAVIVAFYVILIRPAQQEQRRHRETIRDLQVGDEVVTRAGFFARIKDIQTPERGDVKIVLDLGNSIEVTALTSAIDHRVSTEEATETAHREAKEA